jgi:hypothetical protein
MGKQARKRPAAAIQLEVEDPACAFTSEQALAAMELGSEEPACVDSPEQAKAWIRIKKRAGYCGLCADVLRDYTGHASRRPRCKAHKDSRALTEEELMRLEKEFQSEVADPEGAKARRVEAARQRQAKAWKAPEGATSEEEFRMTFGKHSQGKGKTVKEVMQADPHYFKHMMSWKNNIFDSRPDLKQALEKEGLLAELMEQRPSLQHGRASRVMARAAQEEGLVVHPEVKKLRKLQQIEASEVLPASPRMSNPSVCCASEPGKTGISKHKARTGVECIA